MSIKQILKTVKEIIKPTNKPVVKKALVLDKKDLAATVKSTVQESKSSMTRETN
jgi:hypothetical protein